MRITLAHGSGGQATADLIEAIFAKHFANEVLSRMDDSGIVPGAGKLAITTDSFVVTPLCFAGGNIGALAVCGTVNDLLMSGAIPQYITCGFILEEGLEISLLEEIVISLADTAREAGVMIVAGDTKVVNGSGGLYINTTGVGFVPDHYPAVSGASCKEGDVILLSGTLGDHHAAILSARMGMTNPIRSDSAPLVQMVRNLMEKDIRVHAMRDVTRGGLATILREFAVASDVSLRISEKLVPVDKAVRAFCDLLGLDPLYMGNEGKMIAIVDQEDAQEALRMMSGSTYGENAAIIGTVIRSESHHVFAETKTGGTRILSALHGEGLPRIC